MFTVKTIVQNHYFIKGLKPIHYKRKRKCLLFILWSFRFCSRFSFWCEYALTRQALPPIPQHRHYIINSTSKTLVFVSSDPSVGTKSTCIICHRQTIISTTQGVYLRRYLAALLTLDDAGLAGSIWYGTGCEEDASQLSIMWHTSTTMFSSQLLLFCSNW